MDLQSRAQMFEAHIQGYKGDDPLDLWERYVLWAEEALPTHEKRNVSRLLEQLVRTFVEDKRYSNDERFIKCCVKFAQYINEPQPFFEYLCSNGVGRLSATLHVAWAQLLESLGDLQNVSALFRKAFQIGVEPREVLDHHYRAFQIRISQKNITGMSAPVDPLHNSQILNQMAPPFSNPHPVSQSSASENRNLVVKPSQAPTCPAAPRGEQWVTIISKSAVVPKSAPSGAECQQVPMYNREKLICDGSELSFEELRAKMYWKKCEARRKMQQWEEEEKKFMKTKEEADFHDQMLKQKMAHLSNLLQVQETAPQTAPVHRPEVHPTPVNSFVSHPSPLSAQHLPVLGAGSAHQMDHLQVSTSVLHTSHGLPAPYMQQPSPSPAEHLRHSISTADFRLSPLELSRQNQTLHNRPPKPVPQSQHIQDRVSAEPMLIKPNDVPDQAASAGIMEEATHYESLMPAQETARHTAPVPRPEVQPVATTPNVSLPSEMGSQNLSVLGRGTQQMTYPQMSTSVLHTSYGLPPTPVLQPSSSQIEPLGCNIFSDIPVELWPPLEVSRINQTIHTSPPKSVPQSQQIQEQSPANPIIIKPTDVHDRTASAFPDVPKQWGPNTINNGHKLQPGIKEVSGIGNTSTCYGNTSHVTPNTSLGLVQATPSKALPSPTVNTKEALGFIMDIFQTSTLPVNEEEEDQLFDAPDPNEQDLEAFCRNDNNPHPNPKGFLVNQDTAPALPSAFCIFEDDMNKENDGPSQSRPVEVKTLGERPMFKGPLKYKDEVKAAESLIEDCTVWAVRCNKTLAPSPNSTGDFAMAARLASTPSNKQTDQAWEVLEEKENAASDGGHTVFDSSEDKFMQTSKIRKLSPIQEQSPENTKIPAPIPPISSGSVFLPDAPALAMLSNDVEQAEMRLAACKLSETTHQSSEVANFDEYLLTQEIDFDEEALVAAVETKAEVQAIEVLMEDPWDDQLLARLLSELPTQLNSMNNYHEWDTNVPTIKTNIDLKLGSKMFCNPHVLGEGAFAQVFQAMTLDADLKKGEKVTLKVQKPAKPWEFYIGTQIRERINPELKHLYINFHAAHVFLNGSILVGELYNCGSLLNAVNLYKTKVEKVMPIALTMYITIVILYMIEELHNVGIIHGDIKPDNFVLNEKFIENQSFSLGFVPKGLALVDLGQSIDMTLLPKGTVFTGKCETDGFQCVEMLTKKPWTYQTDYFGVAGTVYCMLFGNYMKVRNENGEWKTDVRLKRNVNGELWTEFFHTLLNIPDCHSPSPLKALREKLTSVYETTYTKQLKFVSRKLVSMLLENKPSKK
ncbi:mitotic checkpoint serine/threonine-protein kinase BUB1 isoform 2-T2 [Discoglossus pictus]